MDWDFIQGENPKESGEYIVVLQTEQGPKIEIMNYGVTDNYPQKNWYLVGTHGNIYFNNILAWSEKPDLRGFE